MDKHWISGERNSGIVSTVEAPFQPKCTNHPNDLNFLILKSVLLTIYECLLKSHQFYSDPHWPQIIGLFEFL
jgi:hypothetical protein